MASKILRIEFKDSYTFDRVQVPLHLEIPFADAQINLFAPDGKFVSQLRVAEQVEWSENRLAAIAN